MKKTYIKPETLVVNLNSFESIMRVSGGDSLTGTSWGGGTSEHVTPSEGGDAREVIKTRDAWEEW